MFDARGVCFFILRRRRPLAQALRSHRRSEEGGGGTHPPRRAILRAWGRHPPTARVQFAKLTHGGKRTQSCLFGAADRCGARPWPPRRKPTGGQHNNQPSQHCPSMEYVTLPGTDLRVSRICLGTMQVSPCRALLRPCLLTLPDWTAVGSSPAPPRTPRSTRRTSPGAPSRRPRSTTPWRGRWPPGSTSSTQPRYTRPLPSRSIARRR